MGRKSLRPRFRAIETSKPVSSIHVRSGPRMAHMKKLMGIGPSCEYFISELLAENALYRLRAAQGVIGLADKHDPSRLEAACAKAVAAGDPSYRTVRGILAAGTERDQLPAAAGDGGAAAFLRGPASFANVIPMPGTIPSDAVTPVTAKGAPS